MLQITNEDNAKKVRCTRQNEDFQWAWQDEFWYSKYDEETNQKINQAFQQKLQEFELQIKFNDKGQIKEQDYIINFNDMTQKNKESGYIRQITKVMKEVPVGLLSIQGNNKKDIYLSFIKDQQIQQNIEILTFDKTYEIVQQYQLLLNLNGANFYIQGYKGDVTKAAFQIYNADQFPSYWQQQFQEFYLEKDIEKDSQIFQNVENLMKKTLPNVKIIKLVAIQNKSLYKRYMNEQNLLAEQKDAKPSIMKLFHGTSQTSPQTISKSTIGFDEKYSSEDCWFGKGIYFSEHANYSDDFCFRPDKVQKQMFLCDVIVGETVTLQKGQYIKPPPNPKYSPRDIEYDSINNGNGMYILYRYGRVYPSFLITYQLD